MDEMEMLDILHKKIGLSYAAIGRWINVRAFTVYRYFSGLSSPSKSVRTRIRTAYHNVTPDGVFIPTEVYPISKNVTKLHNKSIK
jgi:hypothetical protein